MLRGLAWVVKLWQEMGTTNERDISIETSKEAFFSEYTHRCGQRGFSNTTDLLVSLLATAAKVTNSNRENGEPAAGAGHS